MNWALGMAATHGPRKIEMVTAGGEPVEANLDVLAQDGVPDTPKPKRLLYEGDFANWKIGSAETYLFGMEFKLPEGSSNRHEVFTVQNGQGVTLHVPALVLLRAFFKPNQLTLPVVFTPGNIDRLSFVDYTNSPPKVVIDDSACAKRFSTTVLGVTQERALQWLQTSKSARKAAQSVYQYTLTGWLKMSLPIGRTRIVFHGRLDGKNLYATKATLISVTVPEHDSVTGASVDFIFHAMADGNRNPTASVGELKVLLHPNGQSTSTQAEWGAIEPLLRGKKCTAKVVHSRRHILDVILLKLSSGMSWKTVPRGGLAVTDLTSTFRRWVSSGRLEKVLDYLETSRTSAVPRPYPRFPSDASDEVLTLRSRQLC